MITIGQNPPTGTEDMHRQDSTTDVVPVRNNSKMSKQACKELKKQSMYCV